MQRKKVRLLKAHTDAGRDYSVGDELWLHIDIANWLIRIEAAVEVRTGGRQPDDSE